MAATAAAGFLLAVQARVNGSLASVLGQGVFAAAASFAVGLALLLFGLLFNRSARVALRALRGYLHIGITPWWALLAGLGGASVALAQGLTVGHLGVAVFTMCFVAGQLLGGMAVDMTGLVPQPRRPTQRRVIGAVIVFAGVFVATLSGGTQDFPWWSPLVPVISGALTAVQQAINGRVRLRVHSAYAATTVNFVSGTLALALLAGLWGVFHGAPVAFPGPGDWWLFTGGALGVTVILVTSATVARLGVLLLSLVSLVGSLSGSLILDLLTPDADVTWFTAVSMSLVLLGVVIAGRRRGASLQRKRARTEPMA